MKVTAYKVNFSQHTFPLGLCTSAVGWSEKQGFCTFFRNMIVCSEIMVLHATKRDVLKFHKFKLISSCATKLIKFFRYGKNTKLGLPFSMTSFNPLYTPNCKYYVGFAVHDSDICSCAHITGPKIIY